jgi:eukaryotic-like serine/threonine-protein kinase
LPRSGKGLVSTLHDRKSKAAQLTTKTEGVTRPQHTDNVPDCSVPPATAAEPEPSPHQQPAENLEKLSRVSYVEAVLSLAERLADGLAHAHDHGVLHRDLKPANVLVTDEGEPMLLDFNLSADRKHWANPTTAIGGGTLPYVAAEHLAALEGEVQAVDERSDLYSLGLILYELLTLRHPFPGRGRVSDILPAMIAERSQPPPSVRCWNPAVSPAVESIVRHLLEPNPAQAAAWEPAPAPGPVRTGRGARPGRSLPSNRVAGVRLADERAGRSLLPCRARPPGSLNPACRTGRAARQG